MAIKVYLFTDPECTVACDRAREMLRSYFETGEVEEMDIGEGLKRFNLGEPAGVPFLGVIAESTKECIAQVYIAEDNEGNENQ